MSVLLDEIPAFNWGMADVACAKTDPSRNKRLTFAPFFRRTSAKPFPRPCAPPVTTATFPFSAISQSDSGVLCCLKTSPYPCLCPRASTLPTITQDRLFTASLLKALPMHFGQFIQQNFTHACMQSVLVMKCSRC